MAESTNESDGSDNSGDSGSVSSGVSYALIHEAGSFTDFENLVDPESVEAEVSRGRGKATINDVRSPEEDDEGNQSDEPISYELTVEEGRLQAKSGYVVRFVSERHIGLNAFDVKSIDTLRDYPAPTKMIEALPARIRGRLKENGFVKIRGSYSPGDKRFYGTKLGWEPTAETDPWDRMMQVIEQVSSTPAAVDYLFVEEGPERWGVEEVAESRGIEEQSVRGNVRAVRNEIDDAK